MRKTAHDIATFVNNGLRSGAKIRRQADREGFDFDDEILTIFERFEVVWPLDVTDKTTGLLIHRIDRCFRFTIAQPTNAQRRPQPFS